MPTFLLTNAQQATLGTEIQNDPKGLGLATLATNTAWQALVQVLTWTRDGITPCPSGNSGPSGTITGATNASPIVITTGAPHGLATGDSVYITNVGGNTNANGYFTVTVLSSTTFSLQTPASLGNVAGNAAYTSGGTWVWCVAGVKAQTVPSSAVWGAMVKGDFTWAGQSTALTGAQEGNAIMTSGMLNQPGGEVQFNIAGSDTNELGIIKSLFTAGTGTLTALTALKYRLGSRIEQLLGISNPVTISPINTGNAPTIDDVAVACGGSPP